MRSSEQSNIEHFDREAESYDTHFNLSVEVDRNRLLMLEPQSHRPLRGERGLDIGCGTGNLGYALVTAGYVKTCVGLDISLGMARIAKNKTKHVSGCLFTAGSAVSIPFADNTFDVVVGSAFLHHIVNALDALREIRRVLKPGGVSTFNEPCAEGYRLTEFFLRTIMENETEPDDGIAGYLHYLTYMREHENDFEALEAYPLPDKHIFPLQRLRELAKAADFSDVSFGASLGFVPDYWKRFLGDLLRAIGAKPRLVERGIALSERFDSLVGRVTYEALPIHAQIFLYK